ncbi:MAG: DUF881 domain-containing protein [Propionibacteriaceae bacterium]
MAVEGFFGRVRGAFTRARERQRERPRGRQPIARLFTVFVCMVAGAMIVVSAMNARGTDLRPSRNTDLIGLVQAQSERNSELADRVTGMRAEVDALTREDNRTDPELAERLERASTQAAMTSVKGSAMSVTLDDAPLSVAADGVDEDLLIVHQQDIQAVVNALWSGGAEAMTIQGQRVISTTGIKCVGNTVVLHGIPYSPPYQIEAIGDPNRLAASLASSEYVNVYRQWADAYGLVYEEDQASAVLPGYQGGLELSYAKEAPVQPSPSASPTR